MGKKIAFNTIYKYNSDGTKTQIHALKGDGLTEQDKNNIKNTLKTEITNDMLRAEDEDDVEYQFVQKTDLNEINDKLDDLQKEMDLLHPLTINTFGVNPSLAEIGSTVTKETFTILVNRLGAHIQLDGQTVDGLTVSREDTLTSNKTYTLTATLNDTTKTAEAKIQFIAPVYYGVSETYQLTNAQILGLTKVLTTSRARTINVNAAAGQYILYALPNTLGTPTFKVGGFEGGFTKAGSFSFTNASGHTEAYNLYRSVNAGLGNTTVAVS